MQADIKRHQTGDGSSVWIDPAYMRHNFVSEQERPAQSPQSPIPARASAQTHRTPGKRPGYGASSIEDSSDITRTPTVPQSARAQYRSHLWQYESPDYEIESSISSLSLVVSDQPTHPETPSASNAPQDSPLLVADLPTRPDLLGQPGAFIDEVDTLPPSPLVLSPLHVEAQLISPADAGEPINDALTVPGRALIVGGQERLTSWTAGGAGESAFARRIVGGQGEQVADPSRRYPRNPRRQQMHSTQVNFNPLDRIRWWLLHPGRIEFILWLAGTVLLITVTCLFLLTTALSFGWLTTGPLSHIVSSSSSSSDGNTTTRGKQPLPTVVTYPGLKLVLLDQGPLLAGQPIHLHGEGFTAQGRVVFTYDTWQPFSNKDGMTDTVKADAHGTFTVTLVSGTGSDWSPGLHLIEARDLATGHLAAVQCILAQGPIGKSSTATPGPLAPGSTPTPTPSQGTPGTGPGTIPTPVGQTPVPVTPTATVATTPTPSASPSPSPTPTQPPVTPTPTTPPPTPTPGITPTVGGSAPSPIPGTSSGAPGTLVGVGASLITPATPASIRPLLWLVIPGYALAMLLLGLAGVLHQHRQ